MSQIEKVHARQILDSRGNPTVEVEVALRSGATRPRGGALGRLDRRVRGDRAARRRRAPGCGKGVAQAVGQRQRRDRRGGRRARRDRPGGPRPRADRARRHAQQVAPGRQRDPRRLARRRPRRRRRGGPAAVALPRRRGRARAAGADDERPQRRRARRQLASTSRSSWSSRSARRRFSECLRMGTEVFHALKGTLHDRGLATAVGDEGGFAPDLESNEAALQALDGGHRGGRLPARRGRRDRAGPRHQRALLDGGAYDLEHEGRKLSADELAAYWADLAGRYPIVSIEDGMDEEDWDGWKVADRARSATASSSSATTCSSPTPSACGAASSRRRQLDPRSRSTRSGR